MRKVDSLFRWEARKEYETEKEEACVLLSQLRGRGGDGSAVEDFGGDYSRRGSQGDEEGSNTFGAQTPTSNGR